MKRALVTGGAGFLGSHLCRRLLADGFEVVALDNLYTGSRRNVEDLLGHPAFRFVEGDVIDFPTFSTTNCQLPTEKNKLSRTPY